MLQVKSSMRVTEVSIMHVVINGSMNKALSIKKAIIFLIGKKEKKHNRKKNFFGIVMTVVSWSLAFLM